MKSKKISQNSKAERIGRESRSRAEELTDPQKATQPGPEPENSRSLVHDLEVYQIELEQQNQELQQLHLEAEQARRKYFDLYDLAPVGYATFGPKGEILEINLTGARLLGEERSRLVNRRFQLFVMPGDIALFNDFVEKVFSTGTKQVCEVTLLKDGGRLAGVRIEGVPGEPKEGTQPVCQAALLDITEQKQAEEALRNRENDLRLVMEAVPALIAYVDTDGRYRRVNRNYARWFGFPAEDIPGRHMSDILGEAQWKEIKPYVERALAGESITYERQLPFQGGDSRWVRASYTPDVNEVDQIQGFVVHVLNIEESKKAAEAVRAVRDELELRVQERTAELEKAHAHLAEQSRILESFFKDTITPLVLLDRDFNFLRVNESYARSCQRAVADFPGHNHFEFYPNEENEAIFRRVVETKTPFQAVAKPFFFPDHPERGVTFWDWTLTPLLDDRGEVASLVFSLEEVTDRQATEEALRSSERELRFLANQLLCAQENERKRIAREMHDSLGASLSGLKYKLEDLVLNLSDRDFQQINETLGFLISIIQETIREARRIQHDLRPPHLDELGILPTLSWLSREFQKTYSRIAVEQGLEVREEDVPERLKVIIFRITQEALNNAGKHAQATRIWIHLSREQGHIKLAIGDNGVGFNYEQLPGAAGQGTGMGLSIMKERAELSGGFFSVESHPGKGTIIGISWPLNGEIRGGNQAD